MLKEPDFSENAAWKQRFRAANILGAFPAKNNAQRGLAVTNLDGVFQLYAWDVPSGGLRRVTDQPAGVMFGAISADGRYIYYHHDKQGNEIGHFVRMPFEGGESQDMTPDLPDYAAASMISDSKDGSVSGFVGADKNGFHAYILRHGQAPEEIFTSKRNTFGPALSSGGEVAVVQTAERSVNLDTSLLAFELATGKQIAELWDGEGTSTGMGAFSPLPGDTRMLASSSRSGYNRPLIWNPCTGERHELKIESIPGEVMAWNWSPDAKRIVLNQLYKAEYQLYLYDLESDTVRKLDHPSGVLGGFFGGYFYNDDEIFCTWQDSVHPSRVIALDARTGQQTRTVLAAGDVPPGHKWRSVTFESPGGQIQGWLATPDGEGPFPTILHTHGGPTAVQTEAFMPSSQAWLDHGFAFMSVNYRGSTTFGKDFEKAIWGRLGEVEVEDMAAAHQWLVANGIAKADEILVTGGSYGGYLTLMSMGTRPDLWAGGMGFVVVADWVGMYADQAETLRAYLYGLFGGSPDDKPDVYAKSSPITYVENIRAPLQVIQGRNDTRCPARQYQDYEDKMKAHNKQVETYWFDAGHGSRKAEEQIEHQELNLRFAYRVLG